ncbi:MAG: hypothetical protein OXH08_12075 [Gammaproteobacteria bacterium]|nr:hypothetical protein [Gammaproteobacteria bacterium]
MFPVTLHPAQSRPVRVNYTTAGRTATIAVDYTATSGKLTFAPGDTLQHVTVAVKDDDEDEGVETMVLRLFDAVNAQVKRPMALGFISNSELTAAFDSLPETHDGTNPFTFRIAFNQATTITAEAMRDHALTVGGGTVTAASKLHADDPLQNLWELTVQPSGTGNVTLLLPKGRACTEAGAVCASDDRPLSADVSGTVTGPGGATNAAPTGLPAISGTAQVGEALTASADSIADADGLANATFAWQWLANDGTTDADIAGATASAYTLTAAEEGKTIKVRATFTDDGGTRETLVSAATAAVAAASTDPIWSTKLTVGVRDQFRGYSSMARPELGSVSDDGFDYGTGASYKVQIVLAHSDGVVFDVLYGGAALSPLILEWAGQTLPLADATWDGSHHRYTWDQSWLDAHASSLNASAYATTLSAGQTGTVCLRTSAQACPSTTLSDPPQLPTVSVSDASATEGDAVAFTVSLSPASSQQVTVAYATSDGTATTGEDFTAASSTLTFAANDTLKTVSVETEDDSEDEDEETFTLTLSAATNASLGDSTATGTIDDNDDASTTNRAPVASGDMGHIVISGPGMTNTWSNVVAYFSDPDGDSLTYSVSTADTSIATAEVKISANYSGGDPTQIVTRAIAAGTTTGTFTATDPGGLSASQTYDIIVRPPPLTATFSGMPASHDGSSAFTFTLTFSEDVPGLGYETLRDHAFDVAAGEVTKASRLDPGGAERNREWQITVAPDGDGDVTVTLPETTDCAAAGAICIGDRPLSAGDSGTVAGPAPALPALSVSDASATEGDAVEFTVSLSPASSEQVTVAYATSGGTATSGTDFTAASSTLTFAANQTSKTVSVATTDDEADEDDETFTLTLSSPTNATLSDATATGTINDNDTEAATPLTASFSGMPSSHTGAAFTFTLTFSENIAALSYITLRDHAFDVTAGSVTKAKRQTQGSNRSWTITVQPAGAGDTVTVTLPETTDCGATGAICAGDGRMLSRSTTGKVAPAASASASDVARDVVAGAMALVEGVSPDEAAAALFGEPGLGEDQLAALDRLGNRNGGYDLGDLLSWIDRCRRGEADCGGTSTDAGPAGAAALPAAARGGGTSRRTGGRAPGPRGRSPVRRMRRRRGRVPYPLAVLLAAAVSWSCTDGAGGPAAPAPDPGFLTVELAAPAAISNTGVLLELVGPGIDAVRAPGYELYEAGAAERRRIVVAGALRPGPLVQFEVPDRNRLALYRVHVLQVTGEDYELRDPGDYRALIRSH